MIVSLTVFSQSATDTLPVKCFPIPVVKLIVKDLAGAALKRWLSAPTDQKIGTGSGAALRMVFWNLLDHKLQAK